MTTDLETLAIRAGLVPHIRHNLHLQLGSVAESLKDAASTQWRLTDRGASCALSVPYRGALKHLDRIRGLLDILGWDASGPEVDVALELSHGIADALYGALTGEIEDLRENVICDSSHEPSMQLIEEYLQLRELLETLSDSKALNDPSVVGAEGGES